jgi:DNA-binding transcriptional MerR regulator
MKTLTLAPRRKTESFRPTRRPTPPPVKLFYRIQEVADMTGLKPSALRYWETDFRELCPEKDAADQRRYRQSDIDVVRAIRKLLYEDRFTIKGARGRLREELRLRREVKEKTALKVARPSAPAKSLLRPSLTEFRTQRKDRGGEAARRRIDQKLRSLRSEVNALLSMLS